MPRRSLLVTVLALVAALAVETWLPGVARLRASAAEGAGAAVPTGPQLQAVSATLGDRTTTLTIEASDPVAYLMSQPDPFTLLIDLRNARSTGAINNVEGRFGQVAGVGIEQTVLPDGTPAARLRVRLVGVAPYNVRSARNLIVVEIGRTVQANGAAREAAPAPAAPRAPAARVAAPASAAPGAAVATRLSNVSTAQEATRLVVAFGGNGRLVAERVEETRDAPPNVVIDFPDVVPDVGGVTDVRQGPVTRVHTALLRQNPPLTRVVIELNQQTSYWVQPAEEEDPEFRLVFENVSAPKPPAPIFAAQVGGPRPAAPLEPMTALTLGTGSGGGASVLTPGEAAAELLPETSGLGVDKTYLPPVRTSATGLGGVTLAQAQAQAQAPAGLQAAAPAGGQPGQGVPAAEPPRQFTGEPVSLDFQGADLRAVLRTFSEISGLNMVIDPNVQGSVDVALSAVPWDQALDIILRTNQLGYTIDGTIVRIAPLSVLAAEEAQRRQLAEEQALAGELQVYTRALSYARAEELQGLLTQSALTQRGTVQVDARTNTLIISDLPDALTRAADLIETLDQPQPQVEIEARIVQTTRDFASRLGVQWGFNGRVAQDLGNTTGLAFPNQGSITGRSGVIQGPIQGEPIDSPEQAINLGVEGASNAIGLALGSVNGAVNLDLALSALERSGNGRLLSTPRVSTQNNIEAEITQGVQIPIQTVANNTVTVTFKDAALTLKVTPQITAANTVIMRISVENASPDFSRSIKDIPPIDTQRANTQVLVNDGETTVIGGIYTSREDQNEDRTPGLHRIPLLGWLFKRQAIEEQSRELLIFITPRIIKT